MKRSGFARPARAPREPQPLRPVRAVAPTVISASTTPRPKDQPARHEGYRRLVAAMPCALCGMTGRSQAAHPNTGKGAGIKADDRLCFPLCADGPGRRGCHSLFDQGGLYAKGRRHEMEAIWTAKTAAAITAAGQWPADLEPLPTGTH